MATLLIQPRAFFLGFKEGENQNPACFSVQTPRYRSNLVHTNKNASLASLRSSTVLHCSSANASGDHSPLDESNTRGNFWAKWMANSSEMRAKVAKLGLAAVLAYGIFDGITYTTFFIFAFLGYEKSTGKNPARNLQALLGIVILMWTGNNVTRPFRVAGAAALAPTIDNGLKIVQKKLNLPSLAHSFALVVGIIAGICLCIAGLLILSRWGK